MRAVVRALPGLGGLACLAVGLWIWWAPGAALVAVGLIVLADAAQSRRGGGGA